MKLTEKQSQKLGMTIHRIIMPGLRHLPKGKPMTAEHLCGAVFWHPLHPAEQVFVDEFFQASIHAGVFDLIPCGLDGTGMQRYARP